ncbi:MAG: thiamine-phosphate kinase [Candidatus Acidiferrales bacterium]
MKSTVQRVSERNLINRIARTVPSSGSGLLVPIGDDAAVLKSPRRCDWVVSCDFSLEGVHFLAAFHPPESVGYKSLARAVSDLAAMGALPRYYLLSMALPLRRTGDWLARFLAGMRRSARELGVVLAGGDTSEYSRICISITVIGEASPRMHALRSGARPGHAIYVSGHLGSSELGLRLLHSRRGLRKEFHSLLRPHLFPRVRISLGRWLAENRIASAMIDLSDGLSADLDRLCRASCVGARLFSSMIPTVKFQPSLCRSGSHQMGDPLDLALHGGEDYELLFTVPPRAEKRLSSYPGKLLLTRIGQIIPGKSVELVSPEGDTSKLIPRGWEYFRGRVRKLDC